MKAWFIPISISLFTSAHQVAAHPLVEAARARLGVTTSYHPAFVALTYPGGDVPKDRGVRTDVVIRALRSAYGFDLQKAVHEDMAAHFSVYPALWGLTKTDRDIDHRRAPNLEAFFTRKGAKIPLGDTSDFQPGDIITWRIDGRPAPIGIISGATSKQGTPLIIHNIGGGTQEDDVLNAFPKVAHFRFVAPSE